MSGMNEEWMGAARAASDQMEALIRNFPDEERIWGSYMIACRNAIHISATDSALVAGTDAVSLVRLADLINRTAGMHLGVAQILSNGSTRGLENANRIIVAMTSEMPTGENAEGVIQTSRYLSTVEAVPAEAVVETAHAVADLAHAITADILASFQGYVDHCIEARHPFEPEACSAFRLVMMRGVNLSLALARTERHLLAAQVADAPRGTYWEQVADKIISDLTRPEEQYRDPEGR